MIVRLKGIVRVLVIRTYMKFQFYDSPIKSTLFHSPCTTFRGFQFYDSPIKRTNHMIRIVPTNWVSIL